MVDLILKEEAYEIIGKCIEVHRNLGKGFLEIVYKDALEFEFKINNISFEREKEFLIHYKNIVLPHKFYADFVLMDEIILEIKSCSGFVDEHLAQMLNYLAVSNKKLGLIVNFGKDRIEYKRVIL
jgi:GxxExxY protein